MNIFLEAFIDKNLGDDLMLELLVRRYPNAVFYAIGPEQYNREMPYRLWENFLIVDHSFWEEYLDDFDAYVDIGGSVWQDYGNNLLWYDVRRTTVDRLRLEKKPCLMIGNNIGPIATGAGEALFTSIMKNLDDITLRDKASFRWAQSRLAQDQFRLTSDVVFSHPFARPTSNSTLIGLTIHKDIVRVDQHQRYIENICRIINSLLKRDDRIQLCLFAFDTGVTQNDAISIAEILAGMEESFRDRVSSFPYEGDIDAFLVKFSQCRHIFASHYHAIVMALVLQIPFTPFAYLNKTTNLLDDLSYEGAVLDYENLSEKIDETVDSILQNKCRYSQTALRGMIADSPKNFSRADTLLRGARSANKNILLNLIDKRIESRRKDLRIQEKDLRIQELVDAGSLRRQEIIDQAYEITMLHSEIGSIKRSFSWKITSPLRRFKRIFKQ